jgi:hypothetical protein
MRLVKRGYSMCKRERDLHAIYTYEEVNMQWCEWQRACSVGWCQNGTLRFFGPDSDGTAWLSRAFDYGAWLKKRRLTLLERYNYNPFDFMKPPAKRALAMVKPGGWYTMEDLNAMDEHHPTTQKWRRIATQQLYSNKNDVALQ